MRVAQQPPWYKRPLLWGALLCALLLFGVGWAAGQSEEPTATASPALAAATVDQHAAMQAQVDKLQQEVSTCRTFTLALVRVFDKQQGQWRKHRGAHHDQQAGKISFERMVRIWNVTIGAGDALDPLVESAAEQWRLHCAKL